MRIKLLCLAIFVLFLFSCQAKEYVSDGRQELSAEALDAAPGEWQVIRFATDPDGRIATGVTGYVDVVTSAPLLASLTYRIEVLDLSFGTSRFTILNPPHEPKQIELRYMTRESADFGGEVPYIENEVEVKVYADATFAFTNTFIASQVQSDEPSTPKPRKYRLDELGFLTTLPQEGFAPTPPLNLSEGEEIERVYQYIPNVIVEYYKKKALKQGEPQVSNETEDGSLLSMKSATTSPEIDIKVDGWYPLPGSLPKGATIRVKDDGKLVEMMVLRVVKEEFFTE